MDKVITLGFAMAALIATCMHICKAPAPTLMEAIIFTVFCLWVAYGIRG